MKIEFTRAEVERILLDHANGLIQYANFDSVKTNSYRDLPDTIIVEKKDAAQ
tara:strand:- start:88 stop:243 length:156 start_codon:yes stop_codon:yes gene_type:complete